MSLRNKALIINNLYHSFDKKEPFKWILNSISLEIKGGELLGLLGPSGCGKTTLLRLIAGFELPRRGNIILNNKEISNNLNLVAPEKRNIGMVFQDYALFPHLNVFQNAIFGLKNKNDFSRVDYLLNILGIDSLRNRFPHELSGGQKQRLAIARALAPGTSFILLDEPFCSLDLNVRLRLRSELPNILKSCNASGLMVTHDPEEAMAICDKVAVMNEGQIHQYDKPSVLINNPKTLFVSSFILGNNIIKISIINGKISSILGILNPTNLPSKSKVKYLSISPKSILIKKNIKGKGIILSKEFLGEFYIYKISLSNKSFRVRTEINNDLSVGDRCSLKLMSNSNFYLYPGGYKNTVL